MRPRLKIIVAAIDKLFVNLSIQKLDFELLIKTHKPLINKKKNIIQNKFELKS